MTGLSWVLTSLRQISQAALSPPSLQVIEEKDGIITEVQSRAQDEIAAIRKAKNKQGAELHRKLREQVMQLSEAEEHNAALQTVFASQLEATEGRVSKSKAEAHSLQMRYTDNPSYHFREGRCRDQR